MHLQSFPNKPPIKPPKVPAQLERLQIAELSSHSSRKHFHLCLKTVLQSISLIVRDNSLTDPTLIRNLTKKIGTNQRTVIPDGLSLVA